MNKKYFDSRKGSVEATINTIRTEQKTIVKEEPKVSLQPKSYFGQKKGSLADTAAKVVSVNEAKGVTLDKTGKAAILYQVTANVPKQMSTDGKTVMVRPGIKKYDVEGRNKQDAIKRFARYFKMKSTSGIKAVPDPRSEIEKYYYVPRSRIDMWQYGGEDKKGNTLYIKSDYEPMGEDVDVDSVNDMALKNAEKNKSKDKESEGKESKSLTKEEQDHIKKEFGIKYEALSPEKQKQMDQLMKDFLARGGKIQKIPQGTKAFQGKKLKPGFDKKKTLAAQKDNSDELAGGKTATGQKVSKVDTRPNIREV